MQAVIVKMVKMIPVWQDCGVLVTFAFNAHHINQFTYLLIYNDDNGDDNDDCTLKA